NSVEPCGTGPAGIAASGDVVKAGGISRSLGDSVQSGIEKPDGGEAISGRLLVDQCGEAGPKRGCATGATKSPGPPTKVNDPYLVGGQSNIGHIALARRACVGGHTDTLLVWRGWVVGGLFSPPFPHKHLRPPAPPREFNAV